jgi:hydroxymethylpyrimidine pyrophosphatase-like HAD family hydrolase
VFTDIDDTLTTDSAITDDALAALAALRRAGVRVIAITGRPVGWCAERAARWPLDAVVAENGAVALSSNKTRPTPAGNGALPLSKIYRDDAHARAQARERMQRVAARVLR